MPGSSVGTFNGVSAAMMQNLQAGAAGYTVSASVSPPGNSQTVISGSQQVISGNGQLQYGSAASQPTGMSSHAGYSVNLSPVNSGHLHDMHYSGSLSTTGPSSLPVESFMLQNPQNPSSIQSHQLAPNVNTVVAP